ncbi:MAG: FtsX-like permease family protein [Sphaerochaetaceae bacterium]
MTLSLAYRNILRNKRRSILSGLAIFIAAIVLCLTVAFQEGMINDMVENIKNHVTGNVLIRNKEYGEHERIMPLQFNIPKVGDVIAKLESIPNVERATPKTSIPVQLYREGKTQNAQAVGIDFATSGFFNQKGTTLVEGTLAKEGTKECVITKTLADKYSLALGDKFTFLSKTATSGSNGMTVTICGIARFQDSDVEGTSFFLPYDTLGRMLRMGDGSLEIQVFTTKENMASRIEESLQRSDLEIRNWTEASIIIKMLQFTKLIYLFFEIIFFLLASTVIFNTTMMSVQERNKEIGTMVALGYSKRQVMFLFLEESAILSFFASLSGSLVAYVLISFMHAVGFDLNAMGGAAVNGMNFSSWIYPWLSYKGYLSIILLGTGIAVLTCTIPARRILKMEPAVALRSDC